MASIARDITLKHKANLGDEVVEVRFAVGDPIEILKEWRDHYLGKSTDGRIFNFPKSAVEGA
jgi:hypothetical protein